MTHLTRRSLLVGVVAASAGAALAKPAAADVKLTGGLTQGGLVIGHGVPGLKVTFDKTPVRVSDQGLFAIGFGRDHAAESKLALVYPDGRKETRALAIAKREFNVQAIDGLPESMVTPPPDAMAHIERDIKTVGEARARDTHEDWFAEAIEWPVHGIISGVYGSQRVLNGKPKQPHFGTDIAVGEGTPIKAPLNAIVSVADHDMYYTGGTVLLDHGGGVSTSYLHMSRLDVKVGDKISQGQVIGAVGKTGRATGPHLCWRLNWFQERLDAGLAAGPMPS